MRHNSSVNIIENLSTMELNPSITIVEEGTEFLSDNSDLGIRFETNSPSQLLVAYNTQQCNDNHTKINN